MKFTPFLPLLSFCLIPFLCNCTTAWDNPCPPPPEAETTSYSASPPPLPRIVVSSSSSDFNSRAPYSDNPRVVEDVRDAAYSRAVIDCSHSSPIRWIADFYPQKDGIRFTQSFHQQLLPSSSNNYSAFGIILYKAGELTHPLLLICQSVCDPGGLRFLEVSPGPLLQVLDAPSNPLFEQLAQKLLTPPPPPQAGQGSCGMILLIQATHSGDGEGEEPELRYRWVSSSMDGGGGGIIEEDVVAESSQLTTDQAIYFHNVFRTIQSRRSDCVRVIKDDERLCGVCRKVVTGSSSTYEDSIHLNSVAIYAKSTTGLEMAFKGVFTLTQPRKFYFDWELPLEEMIDFAPPPIVWVGFEEVLSCRVSTIYFAYGTLIYEGNSAPLYNNTPSQMHSEGTLEKWESDGGRTVSKGMAFRTPNETLTLTCSAPLWDWSTRVEKSTQIFVDSPSPPEIEDGGSDPREIVLGEKELENNITLTCRGIGRPKPTLEWVFPSNRNISAHISIAIIEDPDHPDKITSNLTIYPVKDLNLHVVTGTYLCRARNIAGNGSKSWRLQVPPAGLSKATIVGLSSGLGAVGVIGIGTLCLIYRQILLQRKEYRTRTQEAIKEFKEGLTAVGKDKPAAKGKEGRYGGWTQPINFIRRSFIRKRYEEQEQGNLIKGANETHHISILELPYQDDFEVQVDKWEIGTTVLGQGAFGIVKKGFVEVNNKATVVAVKILKSCVEIEDFKGFLTELKIMAYIGGHSNIVSLVAACTTQIEERDVMIGVEFCDNGSLKDYLTSNRDSFLADRGNHGNLGQTKGVNNPETKTGWSNYANTAQNSEPLTQLDLITWAYQIANGMEFLGSKNVLHGDLATRNVLLTLDKAAKISDFGLSRLLLENKNYQKKSRTPLPWKWMAIESLKTLTFSTASDVWSYAVTLFELFTLGEIPYAGLSYGRDFIFELEDGLRLPQPPHCSDYVYNIMKHCWTEEVSDRLTFFQIKSAFSELLKGGDLSPEGVTNSSTNRLNIIPPLPPPAVGSNRTPVAQPRVGIELEMRSTQDNWYTNAPHQPSVPNTYHNI